MRHHALSHSLEGFHYRIEEGPRWRFLVGRFIENTLHVFGHPCCGRGLGRVPFVCHGAFALLQRVGVIDDVRRTLVLDVPLTNEQAARLPEHAKFDYLDDPG